MTRIARTAITYLTCAFALLVMLAPAAAAEEPRAYMTSTERRMAYEIVDDINAERAARNVHPLELFHNWGPASDEAAQSRAHGELGYHDHEHYATEDRVHAVNSNGQHRTGRTGQVVATAMRGDSRDALLNGQSDAVAVGVACTSAGDFYVWIHIITTFDTPYEYDHTFYPEDPVVTQDEHGTRCVDDGPAPYREAGDTPASNHVAVDRIYGLDRYGTAAAVADATHPGQADTVLVATGTAYPDAVAAGPAAAAMNAPILLVAADSIPQVTHDTLTRLRPSRVVVLGGANAVANQLADALGRYERGGDGAVERWAGPTRVGTALVIAANAPMQHEAAYLAPAHEFGPALGAGPHAAAGHSPLLLTPTATVDGRVIDALQDMRLERLVVAGTFPDDQIERLRNALPGTQIIVYAGTAHEVSRAMTNAHGTTDRLYVATASSWPDALTGGPLAAANEASLLLVTDNVTDHDKHTMATVCPTHLTVFGGAAAVPNETADRLAGSATHC